MNSTPPPPSSSRPNPYRAPVLSEPAELSGAAGEAVVTRLSERERLAVLRGLSATRSGLVALTVALGGCVSVSWWFGGLDRPEAVALSLVWLVTGVVGLTIVLLGVIFWGTVRGPQRLAAFGALALQSLAMVALAGYLSAWWQGRIAGGLFHLFGASALAMLCTSQAIVALVARYWARDDSRASTAGGFVGAVFGYAACATWFSSSALGVLPVSGNRTPALIGMLAGLLAVGSQLIATARLLPQWRTIVRARDSSSLPGIPDGEG